MTTRDDFIETHKLTFVYSNSIHIRLGANDVGAFKQADAGVALISGFGNINVAKNNNKNEESKSNETNDKKANEQALTAIMSKEYLDQIRALPVSLINMKIKQLGTDPNMYPEIVEKEDLVKLFQIKAPEVAKEPNKNFLRNGNVKHG
jgi:hypothetical protein